MYRWTGRKNISFEFHASMRKREREKEKEIDTEKHKRKMSCCHKKINFRLIKNYSWQKTKTKVKVSIIWTNTTGGPQCCVLLRCAVLRFHLSHSLDHNACLLILIVPISVFIFKLDTKYTCEYGILCQPFVHFHRCALRVTLLYACVCIYLYLCLSMSS